MSLQRGVMTLGRYQVDLKPDTPLSVTEQLDISSHGFANVIFTPAPVDPNATTISSLLSLSCFTGIYRAIENRLRIDGPHCSAWLADEDGKGDLLESGVFSLGSPLSNWVSGLKSTALQSGTVTNPGGSLGWNYTWANDQSWNPREALTAVCDWFTAVSGSQTDPVEWEVTNDLKLNAGKVSDVYGPSSSPGVIFTGDRGGRESVDLFGVSAEMSVRIDLEDYTNRVLVQDTDGTLEDYPSSFGSTSYTNGLGGSLRMTRKVSGVEPSWSSLEAVAQGQYFRWHRARVKVDVSTDSYCLLSDVRVGEWALAYDPVKAIDGITAYGFFATAVETNYRGAVIFPLRLRLMEIDQPIQQGMGVYVTYYSGGTPQIVDLTPWVEYENGPTRVTVGELSQSVRAAMRTRGTRN